MNEYNVNLYFPALGNTTALFTVRVEVKLFPLTFALALG